MDRAIASASAESAAGSTPSVSRRRRGGTGSARVSVTAGAGLSIERRFTRDSVHPFDEVQWERRSAVIGNEKGENVFEQHDVEVPASWSQLATNVVVSKYFRGPLNTPRRETSVKQVISRVCDTIAAWGRDGGYFATEADAQAFQDELTHLVLHQKMSFNSPVWFNVGVPGTRPQASACFINSVEDTMESILTLAKTEGMLFKYGSGTGTNLSPLRSAQEQLAGGGTASGPVSFMKGFDAFAGVIKSGGTTRRAAKMVILNAAHPDIEDFITCKVKEERKAWALIEAGYESSFTGEAYSSVFFQNSNNSVRVTDEFMQAVIDDRDWQLTAVTAPRRVVKSVRARELMRLMAESAWHCGDPGIQYDTTINDWHTSANTARINASNPCFPGDTRVHTTKGLLPIAELYRRMRDDEDIRVYTHRITASAPGAGVVATPPVALMRTGVKPLVLLQFSDGRQLRCTPNHRLWTVNRGWVAAESLTADDQVRLTDVATPASDAAWSLPLPVPAEALAVAAVGGAAPTPSHPPRRWSVALGELAGRLVAGATDEGPGAAELPELTALQALSHQATGVPEPVFQAPRDVQVAFLRGLFDEIGCVSAGHDGGRNPHVGLGGQSRPLLAGVQTLLSAFGIGSHLRDTGWLEPNPFATRQRAGEVVTCALRPRFELQISGGDVHRFAIDVGLAAPVQQSQLERLLTTVATTVSASTTRLVGRSDAGREMVYNLTEPLHHSYIVEGFVVANCSEYMFLDDSACNLASLNLMRFHAEDGTFDIDAYRDAVHLTITAQEILVGNAAYPTERIGKNSEDFRPLGLGYANLGALLMARGVPYDSPQGRDLAACLTAIMTGEAYAQSARLAREVGPFNGFPANRQPMLRVVAKHREAAYNIPGERVEAALVSAARQAWDQAHELGAQHGYRNAQATVLAPTGTIGFMMDCDTTGVEPDIALVKYKKLVGGGMLKIVNQTVPSALRRLGYGDMAVSEIVAHIDAHDTIEGAPALRDEDLAVFDCAFAPQSGSRSIAWQGHVRMMSAVQPFISGAISKTVNMPNEATVDDIERAYIDGWKLGLKALAIYRDGSKRSQPLATTMDKTTGKQVQIVERPLRKRLPAERSALTHRFEVGGHEGYITVGLYDDGQPGEIFLRMAKEGSTVSGLMDAFATAVSLALQYGVPLQALVDKLSHTRFDPQGFTKNAEIPIAKSIMDYIFRWLASRFMPQEDRDRLGIIRRDGEPASAVSAAATAIAAATGRSSGAPSASIGVTGPATVPGLTPRSLSENPLGAFVNQEDAPSCSDCGSLMVRSGACYKCHNCGATSGCS